MFLEHGATRLTYHNTPTTRQRVFRTRLCVFRTHTSVSKTRLQHAKFSSAYRLRNGWSSGKPFHIGRETQKGKGKDHESAINFCCETCN